jgi:hypothetical protein
MHLGRAADESQRRQSHAIGFAYIKAILIDVRPTSSQVDASLRNLAKALSVFDSQNVPVLIGFGGKMTEGP